MIWRAKVNNASVASPKIINVYRKSDHAIWSKFYYRYLCVEWIRLHGGIGDHHRRRRTFSLNIAPRLATLSPVPRTPSAVLNSQPAKLSDPRCP